MGGVNYEFPEDITHESYCTFRGYRELAKTYYVYRRFRKNEGFRNNEEEFESIIQQENANRSFILE